MIATTKKIVYTILAGIFFITTIATAQNKKNVVDLLKIPGPIQFDNKTYQLNWSSHPAANFYKQEYLVKGDVAHKYKTMLLIDVVTGDQEIRNVISTKIAGLKKMKETNPVINYDMIENKATGEYILDFLLTANNADGGIAIAERNVYRYKSFTGKSGQKGVMLVGISTRSYDKAITAFLTGLKTTRKDLITKLAQFKMPEIAL
jgi:hypothetical protein